mmetsp:Transcript_8252/g.13704  ORF Transcript_8252/g.13704 Transcript_8252/m.13704 type:complete len:230 (+) Transcript_8252:707-1396(+)
MAVFSREDNNRGSVCIRLLGVSAKAEKNSCGKGESPVISTPPAAAPATPAPNMLCSCPREDIPPALAACAAASMALRRCRGVSSGGPILLSAAACRVPGPPAVALSTPPANECSPFGYRLLMSMLLLLLLPAPPAVRPPSIVIFNSPFRRRLIIDPLPAEPPPVPALLLLCSPTEEASPPAFRFPLFPLPAPAPPSPPPTSPLPASSALSAFDFRPRFLFSAPPCGWSS